MNAPRSELGTDANRPEHPITSVSPAGPAQPFAAIPAELRNHRQFVCWRLQSREGSKPTKLPINPRTGTLASVTNPADWGIFEEAVAGVERWNCDGVGFVFTAEDDLCGIDLDDTHGDELALARQRKIVETTTSYAELSPSGTGLHIICRANLPGNGRRRAFVEVYDQTRFFTLTGKVYGGRTAITDEQHIVSTLYAEMGGNEAERAPIADQPQRHTDDEIIVRAAQAANGTKFDALWAGNWSGTYQSQSEADLALINIIAFYTQNHAQIMRIFRRSELGKRDKAKRDAYLADMIRKAFDRETPSVPAAAEFADRFRAECEASTGKPELKSNVFTFSDFTRDSGPVAYIMHHVLQRGFLYAVTGMWGGGKTALAITVALHVALGLTLCGHRTIKSKVLILCGENPDDVKLRVRAACAVFGIDTAPLESQIFFTQVPFAIDDPNAMQAFVADASRFAPIDLMIIDTGPAHSSVDDENNNRDMHGFAQSIRTLMDALAKPATLVLMHATKSATRETVGTPRGGGAFSGSVDGLCGVWRDESGQMEFFHGTKFRGPGFAPMFFNLEPHELDDVLDNFGEAAISVVAVPTEAKPKSAAAIKGANRIALNALADCRHVAIAPPPEVLAGIPTCDGKPICPPHVVVPEEVWREHCYAANISKRDNDAKSKAFRRARSDLVASGSVVSHANHYWCPEWAIPQPQ